MSGELLTEPETNGEQKELSREPIGGSVPKKVGIRDRLRHFTWAWFTSTMSTGGLAIALAETPHKFHGLYTIGVIVFIFNIVLFLALCSAMTARAIIDFHHFAKSLENPQEAFFFGSFFLSISVILGGIQLYGITYGPAPAWLITAIRVLFWIYAAGSLINSIQQYWVFIIRSPSHPIKFSPPWFLAGYSGMLTGTIASLIAQSQPPAQRLPIIVGGCAFQGFGWLLSSVLLVLYILTLVERGLPPPHVRPAMFIPVGSAAYTVVALIGQARAIPTSYGYFAKHPSAAETLQVVALFVGIFLWLFSFWLFALAVLGCVWGIPKMGFALPWWAFVFPNVGFTLATVHIGNELESEGILWVGSVMTVLLVAIWLFTAMMCIRAVILGQIVFPGKDEDKNMIKAE